MHLARETLHEVGVEDVRLRCPKYPPRRPPMRSAPSECVCWSMKAATPRPRVHAGNRRIGRGRRLRRRSGCRRFRNLAVVRFRARHLSAGHMVGDEYACGDALFADVFPADISVEVQQMSSASDDRELGEPACPSAGSSDAEAWPRGKWCTQGVRVWAAAPDLAGLCAERLPTPHTLGWWPDSSGASPTAQEIYWARASRSLQFDAGLSVLGFLLNRWIANHRLHFGERASCI